MSNDLEQLTSGEAVVTVEGHDIRVTEVTMKHLQAFTAACAPFLSEFDAGGRLEKEVKPLTLFRVISDHADAMVAATALVSNAPKEFLERLKPDQFFRVGAKVLEVNGGFFVRRLAPQLVEFARAMGLVGSMLSRHSSEPGTDTTS